MKFLALDIIIRSRFLYKDSLYFKIQESLYYSMPPIIDTSENNSKNYLQLYFLNCIEVVHYRLINEIKSTNNYSSKININKLLQSH